MHLLFNGSLISFQLLFLYRLGIIVGRDSEKLSKKIHITFGIILAIALFVMGLEIDVKVIWSVLKRPTGPAIGFISQFVFMPLCAYGIAKALLLNGKRQYEYHD